LQSLLFAPLFGCSETKHIQIQQVAVTERALQSLIVTDVFHEYWTGVLISGGSCVWGLPHTGPSAYLQALATKFLSQVLSMARATWLPRGCLVSSFFFYELNSEIWTLPPAKASPTSTWWQLTA
jgi:hypothetical protein